MLGLYMLAREDTVKYLVRNERRSLSAAGEGEKWTQSEVTSIGVLVCIYFRLNRIERISHECRNLQVNCY